MVTSQVNGQGKWRTTYRDYSNESNNGYKFKDTVSGGNNFFRFKLRYQPSFVQIIIAINIIEKDTSGTVNEILKKSVINYHRYIQIDR